MENETKIAAGEKTNSVVTMERCNGAALKRVASQKKTEIRLKIIFAQAKTNLFLPTFVPAAFQLKTTQ